MRWFQLTGDQLIVHGIAKRRNQVYLFIYLFIYFFFFDEISLKNKFSGHMHNFFLLLDLIFIYTLVTGEKKIMLRPGIEPGPNAW